MSEKGYSAWTTGFYGVMCFLIGFFVALACVAELIDTGKLAWAQ